MPTTLKFPAHTEDHCEPCKHHQCSATLHVAVGPGSWREYICTHPAAFERSANWAVNEINAVSKAQDGGRWIGRTEERPAWCPLGQWRKITDPPLPPASPS